MSTRPSALCALLDEILGVGVLAQIGGDGDDLAAGRLGDLLGRGLERLHAARADGDIDAFLGERERDALADAFLPPVTSAVLPLSLRSIVMLPLTNFYARFFRPRDFVFISDCPTPSMIAQAFSATETRSVT